MSVSALESGEGSLQTDVTRALDVLGVEYFVKHHESPALTAELAALERGVRISQIVKCMVGRTAGKSLVVMLIPGDRRLSLALVRKHIGDRSLELVKPDVLESEFGLTVGAISPLQLLGRAQMLIDPAVLDEEMVDISAADPLAGVELSAADLLRILDAELLPMTQN